MRAEKGSKGKRASSQLTVIVPKRGWRALGLGELIQSRGLLYFMIWKDLKIRYKQTIFGIGWALLQPLLLMTIFSVLLGRLARVPSEGFPYPVFVLAGLVPWSLFSQSLVMASGSLVENRNLVSKVYFPRLIIPFASVGSFVIDYLISTALLVILIVYYGLGLRSQVLVAIPLSLLAILSALAVGVWLSAVNAKYRDVRYIVPLLVQVWFFASPVIYPMSLIPESWRIAYSVNPLVGVIEGYRWAFLGSPQFPLASILISAITATLGFVLAVFYFKRTEASFVDVI